MRDTWPEPRAYVASLDLRWDGEPDWDSDAAQPVSRSISILEVEMHLLGYGRRPGEAMVRWFDRWPEHLSGDARVDGDEAWCRVQWRRLTAFAGLPLD